MPATNATSECSFSAKHRVKAIYEAQCQPNGVHKECTDGPNDVDIANELVGDCEHRLRVFGKLH